MVVINPITAISAGIGGLSFLTSQKASSAQAAQQRQAYRDQLAFQKASDTYAKWMAQTNATVTDTEKKYQYWAETINYNQNTAYVNQLRNYELVKAIKADELVRRTRYGAMADYVGQSQALSEQIREQASADAVSYFQFMAQSVKARGSIMATEREGQTMDRLIGDYARQAADYGALQEINQNFRSRQYTREQAGRVADYLSRYNSQQFYQQQPYQDPLPPFQPLPTLVMPQPPSSTGTPPLNTSGINTMSNLLGSINTGLGLYQSLSRFTSSGKGA